MEQEKGRKLVGVVFREILVIIQNGGLIKMSLKMFK
jgi:hypothetical protein